jgi:hypothetical protein
MLDANDPAFRQQYPIGVTIYDRTGRRIANVIECNPETGEVIRRVPWGEGKDHPVVALFRLLGTLHLLNPSRSMIRRHGFWPAPLIIRPNMPPPPKHPMCRCAFMPLRPATEADLEVLRGMPTAGDTVTVIGINGPHDYFNGSYTVSSVSHNTITP